MAKITVLDFDRLPFSTFIGNSQQDILTNTSSRHRDRLEAEGKFPASVKLGERRKGRVLGEVLQWNKDRAAERGRRTIIGRDHAS